MHADFLAYLDSQAGRQYDLHAEHINPAFVRMLRTIDFDKAYTRGQRASPRSRSLTRRSSAKTRRPSATTS